MIEWDENLSIGIPEIDDQHFTFISMANRLNVLSVRGASRHELRELLAELVSYAEHHFVEEERHMEMVDYPLLENHRAQHDAAAAKIHDLLIRDAHEIELYRFLSNFMCRWLIKHIMVDDKAFGAWILQFRLENTSRSVVKAG